MKSPGRLVGYTGGFKSLSVRACVRVAPPVVIKDYKKRFSVGSHQADGVSVFFGATVLLPRQEYPHMCD